MKRLHFALQLRIMNKAGGPCKCQFKKAQRCQLNRYFGLQKPKQWIQPRPGLEGPVGYGKNTSNCNDCAGCQSVWWDCQLPCNFSSPSFFALENARDVEIQTPTTNTSQESRVLYLQQTLQATEYPYTCVVNEGLHEMGITGITTATILAKIEWMLRVLRPVCQELIWISLTDVMSQEGYPQSTSWIVELNKAILEQILVHDDFINWTITVVDPFVESTTWHHYDNVHLNDTYYRSLASLFEKLEETSA